MNYVDRRNAVEVLRLTQLLSLRAGIYDDDGVHPFGCIRPVDHRVRTPNRLSQGEPLETGALFDLDLEC